MTTGNDDSAAAEHPDTPSEVARLQAEVAKLQARLTYRRKARRWLSYTLVIITSLLIIASTAAVWTYRTAFDTDRFMAAVEPTLEDPEFYSVVSDRVADEVLTALGLETRVATRLNQLDEYVADELVAAMDIDPQARERLNRFDRPTLAALAPPITSALEDRVRQLVDRLVTSEAFTTRFPRLVRQAHEASVALIRNDMAELPNVYIADNEVRLNLIPIIRDALRRAVDDLREFLPDVDLPDVISNKVEEGREQLGDALQAQLPPDFGQVTLVSKDALTEVQQTAHRIDQLMWLLLAATVIALLGTVAVSTTKRRTLVQLGLGVVIGLVLGAVVIRRLRAAVLDEVATPGGEHVVRSLFTAMSGSLRTITLLVGAVAVAGAVVAYLAGRPAWVQRSRQRVSALIADSPRGTELDHWVAAHFDLLRVGAVVVAVAVVFVTGIEIVPLVIVALLLALFLWAASISRRQAHQRQRRRRPATRLLTPTTPVGHRHNSGNKHLISPTRSDRIGLTGGQIGNFPQALPILP